MPTLALDSRNGLALPLHYVYGLDMVAQRIRIRLLTGTGEWILDASRGLPYDEWTGVDGSVPVLAPDDVGSIVRSQIEQVTGVVQVVSLTATRTPNGGIAIVGVIQAAADTESGTIDVSGTPDPLDTFGPPMWYIGVGGR